MVSLTCSVSALILRAISSEFWGDQNWPVTRPLAKPVSTPAASKEFRGPCCPQCTGMSWTPSPGIAQAPPLGCQLCGVHGQIPAHGPAGSSDAERRLSRPAHRSPILPTPEAPCLVPCTRHLSRKLRIRGPQIHPEPGCTPQPHWSQYKRQGVSMK